MHKPSLYFWNELSVCLLVCIFLIQASQHQFDIAKAMCSPIGVAHLSTLELIDKGQCIVKWEQRLRPPMYPFSDIQFPRIPLIAIFT